MIGTMSNARRFDDQEIREILDLAMDQEEAPPKALPAADGLTLVELQEVAREVGVAPERVAQAAAALEARGEVVPRKMTFGLPTMVGRVIPLPRNPSDREWELLIAELRTTFGVKGEVSVHGGLREWTSEYLHAFIEPTDTGHRLRLVDASAASAGIVIGGFMMAFALMLFLVLLGKGDAGYKFVIPAFFALFGGGLGVASARWIPKWANRQEARMEQISRRVAALMAGREKMGGDG
jgi:hypothetical protein